MNKELTKEFILLAGYRRFNAVKKLGWHKVSAKVYAEDKVIEIPLDEIDMGDNSRKNEKSFALTELMQSIKQNGLIQPIVVARTANLTEEDFIALNLVENMHRKDLSPFEIGMRVKRLRELGLNNGEVAIRLGIAKSAVDHLLSLTTTFDEKQLEKVEFMGRGNNTGTGRVSYTTAREISTSRINVDDKRKLLKVATEIEASADTINTAIRLINVGMNAKDAIEEAGTYARIHPLIIAKVDKIDKLVAQNGYKSRNAVIIAMLQGRIKLDKTLVYNVKDLKAMTD